RQLVAVYCCDCAVHFRRLRAFQLSLELETMLQASEIKQQILDALVSLFSFFAQRLRNDALQLCRNVPRVTSKWRWLSVAQNRGYDFVSIRSFKWQPTCDHLVNQNTKTEDVGARIQLQAARL